MNIKSISEQSLKEYQLIRKLRAEKFVNIDQIKRVNQKIRELLSRASNSTVMLLFPYRLSFLELDRRLQDETFKNLSELFYLKEQLYVFYNGRAYNKISSQIDKRILGVSKTSSTVEIGEVLKDFGADIIGDDLTICEEILEKRNDIDEISKLINSLDLCQSDLFKLNEMINQFKN